MWHITSGDSGVYLEHLRTKVVAKYTSAELSVSGLLQRHLMRTSKQHLEVDRQMRARLLDCHHSNCRLSQKTIKSNHEIKPKYIVGFGSGRCIYGFWVQLSLAPWAAPKASSSDAGGVSIWPSSQRGVSSAKSITWWLGKNITGAWHHGLITEKIRKI